MWTQTRLFDPAGGLPEPPGCVGDMKVTIKIYSTPQSDAYCGIEVTDIDPSTGARDQCALLSNMRVPWENLSEWLRQTALDLARLRPPF